MFIVEMTGNFVNKKKGEKILIEEALYFYTLHHMKAHLF